jgi:hypothetical protein
MLHVGLDVHKHFSQVAVTGDGGGLLRKHGKAKARVAVAAKLLKAVYYVLKRDEDYRFNSVSTVHLGKPGKVLGHRWAGEALR